MGSVRTLPQELKFVEAMPNATDAAGRTADWISLKNVSRVTILVAITQGNAATVAITPLQATTVAGAGSKAIANALPIWGNADTASTDTLVKQTDAVSFTSSAAVANKHVIIDIDATMLDVQNGFDCISFTTGASNVANITSAWYICQMRFNSATPPSVIID